MNTIIFLHATSFCLFVRHLHSSTQEPLVQRNVQRHVLQTSARMKLLLLLCRKGDGAERKGSDAVTQGSDASNRRRATEEQAPRSRISSAVNYKICGCIFSVLPIHRRKAGTLTLPTQYLQYHTSQKN